MWFILALLLLALPARAVRCSEPGTHRASVYVGRFSGSGLSTDIATLHWRRVDVEDAYLIAFTYGQVLGRLRRDLQLEWELQGVKHFGRQTHVEANALLLARWQRFPWNDWVYTTFALGEGLSLASRTPPLEVERHQQSGSQPLLNYLAIELTLASSSSSPWTGLMRIHHRSGAWGTIGGVYGASNVLAFGVRYSF
jgi:hypothetical protein